MLGRLPNWCVDPLLWYWNEEVIPRRSIVFYKFSLIKFISFPLTSVEGHLPSFLFFSRLLAQVKSSPSSGFKVLTTIYCALGPLPDTFYSISLCLSPFSTAFCAFLPFRLPCCLSPSPVPYFTRLFFMFPLPEKLSLFHWSLYFLPIKFES